MYEKNCSDSDIMHLALPVIEYAFCFRCRSSVDDRVGCWLAVRVRNSRCSVVLSGRSGTTKADDSRQRSTRHKSRRTKTKREERKEDGLKLPSLYHCVMLGFY